MAAAAPRNLWCLWASAVCVQPQPPFRAGGGGGQQQTGQPRKRMGCPWRMLGGRKKLNATRGCGGHTCPMRSGRLRGSSAAFIRSARCTRQRGRCKTARQRTHGTPGCVRACMQRTRAGCCACCAVGGRGAGVAAGSQATAGGGGWFVCPPPVDGGRASEAEV